MKLNKKETIRINDLIKILESIKKGEKVVTDNKTLNNIEKVLGYSLKNLRKKKDVELFVKGKENHIIEHYNTNRLDKWCRNIPTYFYFPFQIKKIKDFDK